MRLSRIDFVERLRPFGWLLAFCAAAQTLPAEWPAEVTEIRYLSEADGSFQPAMYYTPPTDEPVPLLVGLHTWSSGYRQTSDTFGGPYAAWCIERGWAFIGPHFRGPNRRPEATGSELVIEDVVSAVEHMRAARPIDPQRIYAVGVSGGGHLGLLLAGRRPDLWAGVSAWVGINDLAAWHRETRAAGLNYWKDVEASCGGPPGASPEVDAQYRRRSPQTWLPRALAVPLDIQAGISDGHTGSVPIRHSLEAFNLVAHAKHRFTEEEITELVDEKRVPTHLVIPITDPLYGDKVPLLRRSSRHARLTIFEGGHEILPGPALEWLQKQRRRPRLRRQRDALEDLLRREYSAGRFHGVVLVGERGKVLFHESLGDASAAGDAKLWPDSVFRLASVSKPFTGMAVALLCQDTRLAYDDDVRRYIPELPYEGVLIRHLLWHTSGLPDYIALLEEHWDAARRGQADRRIARNADALALLVEHRPTPLFAPGTAWRYSNTGYMLLALVVERITGESFGEFLKRRIFKPLEMNSTFLFNPLDVPRLPRRAYGFSVDATGARTVNDEHFLNGMYGDGAVFSTAEDLFRWDQALYGERLASREVIQSLFLKGALDDGTPVPYGAGWLVKEPSGRRVHHGGQWVGFRTLIDRDLEKKRVVIVLTNHTTKGFRRLTQGILDCLSR